MAVLQVIEGTPAQAAGTGVAADAALTAIADPEGRTSGSAGAARCTV